MTLETIYFISQVLAAVCVIASLIFVGVQVRQSTKQAKADAVQAVHDNLSVWYMQACLLYTSPSPRDQRGSRMPSSA